MTKIPLTVIPLPEDMGSFQLGGTLLGVSKSSKVKAAAIDYLLSTHHTIEGVKWIRDNLGNWVPLKAAYADPATLGPYQWKNFGDFDYGGFYMAEVNKPGWIPAIPYSVYDQVVRQAMTNAENMIFTNDKITAQELLAIEIAEVKAALPDKVIR